MYAISGTVVHHTKNAQMVREEKMIQIPTFYLDENVQGIMSEEHAVEIAKKIVMPVELDYETVEVHLTAVKL